MRNQTKSGEIFPYSFEFRVSELKNNFIEDKMFIEAVNVSLNEYNFKNNKELCTFEEFIIKYSQEMQDYRIKCQSQPGYSLSLFSYLEDLTYDKNNCLKEHRILSISEFLNASEHFLYPMLLIRPNQKFIDEVNETKYISCLYTLDCYHKVNVSSFMETEIAKVWFNRMAHSQIANFNNVFCAGVMYFCSQNKELLFINNASGHYRILNIDDNIHFIKSALDKNKINWENCRYSTYDDVEFKNSKKL